MHVFAGYIISAASGYPIDRGKVCVITVFSTRPLIIMESLTISLLGKTKVLAFTASSGLGVNEKSFTIVHIQHGMKALWGDIQNPTVYRTIVSTYHFPSLDFRVFSCNFWG